MKYILWNLTLPSNNETNFTKLRTSKSIMPFNFECNVFNVTFIVIRKWNWQNVTLRYDYSTALEMTCEKAYGGWMRSGYAISHRFFMRILPKLACMLLECTCIELVKVSVLLSLHAQVCEFQPELWSCKQRAVRFTTLIPDSPHPSVLALPCQPPCLHVETSGWLRDVTGMLLGFGQSRESDCTRFRITRLGVQVWVAISVVVFGKLSMQDLQSWHFWKRRWHAAAVLTSHLVWVWCTANGVTLILYSVKCLLIRFLRERH